MNGDLELAIGPLDRPESCNVTQVMRRRGRDDQRRPDGGAATGAGAVALGIVGLLIEDPMRRHEDRAEPGDFGRRDHRLRLGRPRDGGRAERTRQDGGRHEAATGQAAVPDPRPERWSVDGIRHFHRAKSSLVLARGIRSDYGRGRPMDGWGIKMPRPGQLPWTPATPPEHAPVSVEGSAERSPNGRSADHLASAPTAERNGPRSRRRSTPSYGWPTPGSAPRPRGREP